jgi:hypothetical protein
VKIRHVISIAAATAVLLVPGIASAGTPTPIPLEWGGGSAVVDLPDFTYPASNGCYKVTGSLSLPGNNPYGWDYFTADLTVTDSIGRIKNSFFEFEDGYATTIPLDEQLCYSFDAPGTYNVSGKIEFNDYPYEYTVLVADTFVINPYVAPVVTPPPAPAVSAKCKAAKKQLKMAKRLHKPQQTINRLKAKVERFC